MKTLIVPTALLAAANLCKSGNDDPRHYLRGIFINNDLIAGTNGRLMFYAEWGAWRQRANTQDDHLDVSNGLIIRMSNPIPSYNTKREHARLQFVDEKRGIVEYVSSAGKESVASGAFKVIDGKYPNLDKIISGVKGDPVPVARIMLNQEYVSLAGKVFSKISPKYRGGTLTFFGENKNVLIQNEHYEYGMCNMIVMPMHM